MSWKVGKAARGKVRVSTCIATCTLQPGQEGTWRCAPRQRCASFTNTNSLMHKYNCTGAQMQLNQCTNTIALEHKYNCIGAHIRLNWCTNTIALGHKYNCIGAEILLHWCKYASAYKGEPVHLLLLARGKPKLNFRTSEASKHRGGAAAKFDSFLFWVIKHPVYNDNHRNQDIEQKLLHLKVSAPFLPTHDA